MNILFAVCGEGLGHASRSTKLAAYLEQHGLLSYTDFILEKEKDGTFSAPNTYSYLSLAQSSTHDQATAIGLWTNEDIKTFRQCGMYATETQYNQSLNDRRTERKNMIKAFTKEGLLSDESKAAMDATVENGETAPKEIGDILNTFCAKSNSALYLPRLCDIFKQQKMDNAPGIIDAYPNWRLKMEKTVSEIRQSPEFRAAMDEIRKYRPQ